MPKILIVGVGAAGCEVAANALALLDRVGLKGEVTIAERGGSLCWRRHQSGRRSGSFGFCAKRARGPLRPARTGGRGLPTRRLPRVAPRYRGESLPKLGVFAVRQGPVIFHNLQATFRDEPLAEYKPQKGFLYILNLGDVASLAVYGPFVWRGRLSWWLKHRMDKQFVRRYRG